MGEDGVHPDHPKDAGAQHHDDGGDDGLAQPPGGGDGAIHERGDAVGEAHDLNALHARVDDGGLGGEEGEEIPPEEEQAAAQHQTDAEGVGQRDEVALLHPVGLACTVVLAHNAGAGHVEGGHGVVNEVVGVGGSGVALDHEGIEGVDARLNEEVGNGEDGVLAPGRDAQRQDALGHGGVEMGGFEIQPDAVLRAGEGAEDEEGGEALGDAGGQRHARHVQLADDDEEQVEQDVQNACDGKKEQRLFGVADGAVDGVAEVVEGQRRHTEEVDPQVQNGTGEQVLLGVEQAQQGGGAHQTDEQQDHACDEADQNGGVDGLADVVRVAGTVKASHQHVDAVAEADEEAREEGDEDGGGTYRTQRGGACKTAHHRYVRQVEQHLQQIGKRQRKAHQQDLLGERAFRQRFGR